MSLGHTNIKFERPQAINDLTLNKNFFSFLLGLESFLNQFFKLNENP